MHKVPKISNSRMHKQSFIFKNREFIACAKKVPGLFAILSEISPTSSWPSQYKQFSDSFSSENRTFQNPCKINVIAKIAKKMPSFCSDSVRSAKETQN